jgi:hypothetical protein
VAEFETVLLRDDGTVTTETIPRWQITDFGIIERIMSKFENIKIDLHSIWNQKKDCLRETRLFAEKKFAESGQDDAKFNQLSNPLLTVLSGAEARLAPTLADQLRGQSAAPTGQSSVFSVGKAEESETKAEINELLSVPKVFGPPSRRKQ